MALSLKIFNPGSGRCFGFLDETKEAKLPRKIILPNIGSVIKYKASGVFFSGVESASFGPTGESRRRQKTDPAVNKAAL